MVQLKQNLIQIITMTLVYSLLQTIQQNETAKMLTKCIFGLYLATAIVSPLNNIDLSSDFDHIFAIPDLGEAAVSHGEESAHTALSQCIIEKSEAYILEKAAELDVSIEASVCLSSETIPVPESVVISGKIENHKKIKLETILITQLGIAKENITWIG